MSLLPTDPVSQVKDALIGALAVLVVVIIGYLYISRAHLQTELAKAQTDIIALTDANLNFADSVKRQNAAIESANAQAKAAQEAADMQIAEAQRVSQTYIKRADELMKAKPNNPDECIAIKALIDGYFQRVGK